MTSTYCRHDRTAEACEECAYARAKAEGRDFLAPRLYPPTPENANLDTASEDILVDVGGNVSVLVMAGDTIPADIGDRPRRPRDAKTAAKRRQ